MSPVKETLRSVPLFASLTDEAITALDRQCIWRRYDADQEIVGQGEPDTDVYFVIAGQARVVIPAVKKRETLFRDIHAGSFFGELAAIDGRERSASILAMTNATIARMPALVFKNLMHENPAVCDVILGFLVNQIRTLTDRVNEFSNLNVRHRIYAELLRMASPQSRKTAGNKAEAVISPPPYQHEIAARVATHREAVSREMKELEREGLLTKRRGALVLTDPSQLASRIEKALEE
ncbi:MAG: Crp/Fnr family transcriptional regulator [Magnetovibrionaceae bacterium]